MKIIDTELPGLKILEPKIFEDMRGYFFEAYSRQELTELKVDGEIGQINQSYSCRGVLRGLHFQQPPYAQWKLAQCLAGRLFDVAVDMRIGSPTCGKWFGLELSEQNHKQLFVPIGFAHGFFALTDCRMIYAVGNCYEPNAEAGLRYNDPAVGIEWPIDQPPQQNERDKSWPPFDAKQSLFKYKT